MISDYDLSSNECEENMVDLKVGPPYTSKEKILVKGKLSLVNTKKYRYDTTKAYKTFDILLKDKQSISS